MPRVFQSFFQSSLGSGAHRNYEAVVLDGDALKHWYRDNADGAKWKPAQTIVPSGAVHAGAMIQSSRGNSNFEVVVPCLEPGGNVALLHFWRDNTNPATPWQPGARVTEPGRKVLGAASLIESDIDPGGERNFEVVVPVVGDDGRAELRHYFRNNAQAGGPWSKGQRINPNDHEVLGPACLIQSTIKRGRHGNFEVVAWVRLPDGREVLQHYWRYNDNVALPWEMGGVISDLARGPAVIIQGDIGSLPHRNFEVVGVVAGPGGGTQLQHFFRDNGNANNTWQRGRVISEIVTPGGAGCIMRSSYPGGGHASFEVLVEECVRSLTSYWRSNQHVTMYWHRAGAFYVDEAQLPATRELRQTKWLEQVTGQVDRSVPAGLPVGGQYSRATNNAAACAREGIEGTDLGSSFVHMGKTYFLFGDTRRAGEPTNPYPDLDAIAFTNDTAIAGSLNLTFLPAAPICSGIRQDGFNVPCEGFSYAGLMVVFFTTDSKNVPTDASANRSLTMMLRTVLATSEDNGRTFTPLVTWSDDKFINVSVEVGKLSSDQAQVLGWDDGAEVLWLWGSGRYRSSPAYLAVAHLKRLWGALRSNRDGQSVRLVDLLDEDSPVKYFTGNPERPRWSSNEYEACPLFCCSEIGELSCRWNPFLERYLMTYNAADNPGGIILRYARAPWGPWSAPHRLFDPWWGAIPGVPKGEGYGTFMHVHAGSPWFGQDHTYDNLMGGSWRTHEWGGVYGPYQIASLTTGVPGRSTTLHWLMSTWNPYQVMLMRSQLSPGDLT